MGSKPNLRLREERVDHYVVTGLTPPAEQPPTGEVFSAERLTAQQARQLKDNLLALYDEHQLASFFPRQRAQSPMADYDGQET